MSWFNKGSVDGKIESPIDMVREADSVSRPMAIMVVITIILLTASVVFCFVIGGRWAFNKLRPAKKVSVPVVIDKNNNSTVNQSTVDKTKDNKSDKTTANSAASVPNSGPTELPRSGPEPE